MTDVLTNPVIVLSLAAWLLTQTTKYLLARPKNPQARLSDPGGMPSSHAAVVAAATTVIGLDAGIDSNLFGLAIVVTAIVLHDAFRLRWAVGEQSVRTNEIIKRVKLQLPPVVVWRGHRLREVIVGFVIGTIVAGALYQLFYTSAT